MRTINQSCSYVIEIEKAYGIVDSDDSANWQQIWRSRLDASQTRKSPNGRQADEYYWATSFSH
jgi:hypothetical protein